MRKFKVWVEFSNGWTYGETFVTLEDMGISENVWSVLDPTIKASMLRDTAMSLADPIPRFEEVIDV